MPPAVLDHLSRLILQRPENHFHDAPPSHRLYRANPLLLGSVILASGLWNWTTHDAPRYLAYCAIALLASGHESDPPRRLRHHVDELPVRPHRHCPIQPGETLAMGCLGILAPKHLLHQEPPPRRPDPLQRREHGLLHPDLLQRLPRGFLQGGAIEDPIKLLLAAATFFATNTLSVAAVIGLTEDRRIFTVWRESYLWSFPNYLVGAAVAWIVNAASALLGWQTSLLLLPILYVIYRSHSQYVNRLEDEKKRAEQMRAHAEEVAALHRRTIEVLALAIEAKDQTTHDHLERVEVYAIAVGEELGLDYGELEALRASALLHDIGKLAVPEYIISKPGKLTPAEFEKMKTHTVVGAEIVEQIRFPYPVAPIVRSHHEKWDGTGYPDGLSREQIPIGARILSAVDCLDALASDRQYRRALPLDEAIKIVESESGKAFDPKSGRHPGPPLRRAGAKGHVRPLPTKRPSSRPT